MDDAKSRYLEYEVARLLIGIAKIQEEMREKKRAGKKLIRSLIEVKLDLGIELEPWEVAMSRGRPGSQAPGKEGMSVATPLKGTTNGQKPFPAQPVPKNHREENLPVATPADASPASTTPVHQAGAGPQRT